MENSDQLPHIQIFKIVVYFTLLFKIWTSDKVLDQC